MTLAKKAAAVSFLLMFAAGSVFSQSAQTTVKGKLIKATRNGKNITSVFEPIVSISQEDVLGVRSIRLELSGVLSRDSKVYEFYNDGKNESQILWKRRMRGVVVQPIAVFITTAESENNTNLLCLNYEYRDSKGFGSVDYIIETEK
ncbi:MAG: hypothetical protein LBC72_01715 [Spirochaetaceae bacterium]|jgi:hypothetical protein|nr:hypothetical protein [Spirochaetaceae bacterium]